MLSMENSKFAVTNSTLKVAQIYCSTLYHYQDGWYFSFLQQSTNTVFTFNNSNVELAFPPGSTYATCSGLYFSSNATKNVVLLDGANNVFKTQNLMIAGKTNSFEMADGELYVYRYLYTGTEYAGGGIGNTVKFSGGDSKIKRITLKCRMKYIWAVWVQSLKCPAESWLLRKPILSGCLILIQVMKLPAVSLRVELRSCHPIADSSSVMELPIFQL